jgi:hypothetical protein
MAGVLAARERRNPNEICLYKVFDSGVLSVINLAKKPRGPLFLEE